MAEKEQLVIDYIKEQIASGFFQPGSKIPSENEFCEILPVSKLTANKAVGKLVTQGVLYRTRGRGGTRVSAGKRFNGSIACIMRVTAVGSFVARIFEGTALATQERNYLPVYFSNTHFSWENIISSGVAGVLCNGGIPLPEDFPLPVVNIGREPESTSNNVFSDDRTGGRLICEKMLNYGHDPVVITHALQGHGCYDKRIDGFLESMRRAGIKHSERRIFSFDDVNLLNSGAFFTEIRRRFPNCTGALCVSDYVAYKFIEGVEKHNLKVPQDFSVAGYAGMREIQQLRSIDSVNEFPEELGYAGCNMLLDIIEEKSVFPVQKLIVPELIPGSTLRDLR